MSYDIGPKIGIDGEAEFRKAIQSINTNIKTLGTEMLAVTSAYDANDKSVAALTARNQVLVKQIDAQKEKLAKLQEGLDAAAAKYGEADGRTQRWRQTVNVAEASLNKLERQLAENTRELDENSAGVAENSLALEKQGGALDNVKGKLNAFGPRSQGCRRRSGRRHGCRRSHGGSGGEGRIICGGVWGQH